MAYLIAGKWLLLFLLAWAADFFIKKYWGKEGLRLATLALAAYALFVGIQKLDILELAFGVFMLWAARPKQKPSAPPETSSTVP